VKTPRIFALSYHDVVRRDAGPSGVTGVGRGHYAVAWERFSEHLDAIARAVSAPPSVDLDGAVAGRALHAWCLTFDDGGASALEVGEELRRRDWRAYFFITTGLVGRSGFLGEDAIRELDRMNHVVGSHSVRHPDRMSSLPTDKLLAEWQESVASLSELLRHDVRAGSVPGGDYSRRVAALAARAGITTLFTSEPDTAPRWVEGCLVLGRYPIRRRTTARAAARAATGHPAPWLVHYAGWTFRKAAKAHSGTYYDRMRRRVLEARYGAPARR
jgi:peptidoglycan/xylan/chitin deacetylase (PgdA/CDA1 family)